MEINKDQPNENRLRLLEFSLTRESATVNLHSAFCRDSKAGRGAGKLYSGKTGKASGVP